MRESSDLCLLHIKEMTKRETHTTTLVWEFVELETPGTTSKLVELKKTYASSVRNQNNRVEVDLAECEEIYPSTH